MIKKYAKNFGALETVAFVTGAALMIYELTASRMLAPTIGSSIYVWTSVIGVIIAALSLGYTVGGRLSDKRVLILDIPLLLLATAVCMINTLLLAPLVLTFLVDTVSDPRMQGLFASLILFMPASFVLGIISPYLVRLHTASLATAGSSVASLSALNAIGGILGTFGAGFIFFSYMGVNLTLSLLCLLVVGTSWIIQPKKMLHIRVALSLCLVLLTIVALSPTKSTVKTTEIDTPSGHYQVVEGLNADDRRVRLLTTGPNAAQSGIFLDNPNELVFDYTQKMAAVTHEIPHKNRILILGGGTYTQAQYLADLYPGSDIDVVEIDPKLVDIAKEHFGYKSPKNVQVIAADARAFLNANKTKYDIIYVDIYSDAYIPFSVATKEYVQKLRSSLTENGVAVANIIAGLSPGCAPLLSGLHTSYASGFMYTTYLPTKEPSLQKRQNIIGVYSDKPLDWLSQERAEKMPRQTKPFTDNFAPLEKLAQNCRKG